jgi:hypothetical protein
MFIQAHKLKRDYKATYTLNLDEGDYLYGKEYTMIFRDCLTYDEAYDRFCDSVEFNIVELLIDIEAVDQTHTDKVNAEVYELVLATLFDGEIAVNGWLDEEDDNWEINAELSGIEKILVEHQAQVKYNKLSGAV